MIVFAKAHPATRTMRGGDPTPEQAASGKYPKERMPWQGLTIAIEHPEGTVREGVDETGKPWRTVFRYAYGEILGTLGLDGDPVDVFIGSYSDAPEVYVVQQMKRKQWDTPDEQKCMINFASEDEAKAAYLQHYDDARFFGGITAMPVEEFVTKVRATREEPKMIKSQKPMVLFFKAHVGPYLRGGKMVNLQGYQGRQARAVASHGQLSLFGSGKPLGPSPFKGKDPVASTPDLFYADEHGEMPPARPAAAPKIHEWADREKAPVGSWVKADFKLTDSQPVYQVRELPLDNLYLPELDGSGRLQPEKRKYLDGYIERAKAGERAPSINVIEMESGKLRVVDGHRRALAARAAGKTTIRTLVSPLIDTPDGKKEATAEPLAQVGTAPMAKSIIFLRCP